MDLVFSRTLLQVTVLTTKCPSKLNQVLLKVILELLINRCLPEKYFCRFWIRYKYIIWCEDSFEISEGRIMNLYATGNK